MVRALNDDDQLPYGGWNDGKGLTTRELGRKLAAYEIRAKTVRLPGDALRAKGYEREQFEDAWERYLPIRDDLQGDTATTQLLSQKAAETKGDTTPLVTLVERGPNPHEQSDVTLSPFESADPEGRAADCRHPRRWLARDRVWRCRTCEPPLFESEVVDERQQAPAA
jgi:hypothetical protein